MTAAPSLDLPPGGLAWDETLELEADDGVRLRGAVWRGGDRGLVLLSPGRTEFLEKCAIPAGALVSRGFSVASVDWRGQGMSERLVSPGLKGHVGQFTDFHRDLKALMAHPLVAAMPGPRLMMAHSMGGAIGLGAVARGQLEPVAVILSAPMLGIAMGALGKIASAATLPVARVLGLMERWPPFAPKEPYVFSGYEGNLLTGDRAVFDWIAAALRRNPALQLASPTMGWIDAALSEAKFLERQGSLRCPGLCLLGTREQVVDAAAIRRGAPRLGARLVEIEGARHEVLIEAKPMRGQAWEAIDGFLESAGF
jgi:lysophospholipase